MLVYQRSGTHAYLFVYQRSGTHAYLFVYQRSGTHACLFVYQRSGTNACFMATRKKQVPYPTHAINVLYNSVACLCELLPGIIL